MNSHLRYLPEVPITVVPEHHSAVLDLSSRGLLSYGTLGIAAKHPVQPCLDSSSGWIIAAVNCTFLPSGRALITSAQTGVVNWCQSILASVINAVPQHLSAANSPNFAPTVANTSAGGNTVLNGSCLANFTFVKISTLTFQPTSLVNFAHFRRRSPKSL